MIVPTTNHTLGCFSTSQAGASDPPTRTSDGQVTRRVFRTVVHTPSCHRLCQLGLYTASLYTATNQDAKCEPFLQLIVLLSAAPFEPLHYTVDVCHKCASVVDVDHGCVLRVSSSLCDVRRIVRMLPDCDLRVDFDRIWRWHLFSSHQSRSISSSTSGRSGASPAGSSSTSPSNIGTSI